MELALFRQRSLESRMAMAQRGELFTTLPAGYEKVERNRIEMTADQRQRDAIHLVFSKFRELGSIRQVYFWFRRNAVELPVRTPGPRSGLEGSVPRAGGSLRFSPTRFMPAAMPMAAAAGRRRSTMAASVCGAGSPGTTRRTGRSRFMPTTMATPAGTVFERHQELLSENMTKVRGAVRNGPELLTGLLRCGHCDTRIQVRESGKAIV